MDPYKRITARQAIEHDWFDDLRSKDPEYIGDQGSSESEGVSNQDQESSGQILGNNKRVLSPDLLNQRNRQTGSTTNNGTSQDRANFHLSNKNSYSHASHHAGIEPSRRSENNYHMQNNMNNIKSHQAQQHPSNIIHAGGSSLPSQGKMNSS